MSVIMVSSRFGGHLSHDLKSAAKVEFRKIFGPQDRSQLGLDLLLERGQALVGNIYRLVARHGQLLPDQEEQLRIAGP